MSETRSIPPTMKAVLLEKPGGSLVVKEVKTPIPGPGEVLVKMCAAPVNPSDLAGIRRAAAEYDLTTFIPGLEGSGTVVAAGKGLLPRIWMGKRVACSPEYHASGTWAEYMVTNAGKCFPLSAKVDDEQGAMSLVNPLTALGFFEIAKEQGHKAIINNAAASALGRMVELIGNKHNVPVINIVRRKEQADNLRNSGSVYVLDSSSASFIDELGKLSHELKATILFDSTCTSQLGRMIEVLPSHSSVVIYGNLSGEENIIVNPRSLIGNDIRITGFYLGGRTKENGLLKNIMNLREVSRLMSSEMKIKIQARYTIDRAREAVDTYLADMSAGKVLIVMPE